MIQQPPLGWALASRMGGRASMVPRVSTCGEGVIPCIPRFAREVREKAEDWLQGGWVVLQEQDDLLRSVYPSRGS